MILLALLAFWIYRRRKRTSDRSSLRSSTSDFGDSKIVISNRALDDNGDGSSWIDFDRKGSMVPEKQRSSAGDNMEYIEGAMTPIHDKFTVAHKAPSETSSFAQARAHIRKSQQSFLNLLSARPKSDAETLASESRDSVGSSRGMPRWIDVRRQSTAGQSNTIHRGHQRSSSDSPSSMFTPAPFLAAGQSVNVSVPARPSYIRSKSGKTSFFSRRLLGSDSDYQIKRKKPPRPTTAEVRMEQQDLHSEIVRLASTPPKAFVLDVADPPLPPKSVGAGYRGSASLRADSERSIGSYPQAPSEEGEWNAAPTRASSIDLAWVMEPTTPGQSKRVMSLRSQHANKSVGIRSPRRKASSRKSSSSNRLRVPSRRAEGEDSPALPSSNGSSRPHSLGSPYTPPSASTVKVGRAM